MRFQRSKKCSFVLNILLITHILFITPFFVQRHHNFLRIVEQTVQLSYKPIFFSWNVLILTNFLATGNVFKRFPSKYRYFPLQ